MKMKDLPADSRLYAEMAFREKEEWRRRRARMSLTRKVEALDRLLSMAKEIPKLGRREKASGLRQAPERKP